ncbi:MAG: hypothetical protein J6J64_04545 [Alistipes sp.]|uniref:hypothetical protein n=1 Tax=Alistipes sp. TaxID=1872444 RepID=UPI001B50B9F3|nr:hypothetical protein [Alistipes sp.]
MLAAVVGLVYWIGSMLATPIQFEKHFSDRSNAVIEKEEYIIKLVQSYRDSHPEKKFTTNWDELIDFALNGTMEYRSQIYDENNLKNAEILAELRKDPNWKNERVVRVAARDTIFDDDFGVCRLSEEQIRHLRYIPFTNNTEEFELDTATYESGSYRTHLIRCHAPFVKFIDVETYNQEFWNEINDRFNYFINHSEANEDMKKMKADGLKTTITKSPKYMIGDAHPIPMDIEFFGISFGSLEEPTNEAGSWGGMSN